VSEPLGYTVKLHDHQSDKFKTKSTLLLVSKPEIQLKSLVLDEEPTPRLLALYFDSQLIFKSVAVTLESSIHIFIL